MAKEDYYVYVYIDPRNYEEFYYGMGQGERKKAHLTDAPNTDVAERIDEIEQEGCDPIVRVIARGLTRKDAMLVESTLIWKGRHTLDNAQSGPRSAGFRPHDTMHKELLEFDYQRHIYFYNVGEHPERNWDDYRRYGFISAGQGAQWRDSMLRLNPGDVVAAYLSERGPTDDRGYVGIGRVKEAAKPVRDVKIDGQPLLTYDLKGNMSKNVESDEKCEYVAVVDWLSTLERQEATRERGLFSSPNVVASLKNQPETIEFLEAEFDIELYDLVR